MKEVRGVAGDRYCWREDLGTHELNGQPMPPPLADAMARGLEPWRGCQLLKSGELVGYGQSTDSYDSRYLGPIRADQLYGTYFLPSGLISFGFASS